MLAARGVSLGLGKINLADLNQVPEDRARLARLARPSATEKPKLIVVKKADAKTVWAACRAVIFGCVMSAVGLGMAILGYFDKILAERREVVEGEEVVHLDKMISYQLKAMQYIGPILMGIGTFVLIIACVITLESRDKHAQIIQQESTEIRKRRAVAAARKEKLEKAAEGARADPHETTPLTNVSCGYPEAGEENGLYRQGIHSERKEVHLAEVHKMPGPRKTMDRLAPLADLESLLDLPLSSISSSSSEPSALVI